jgi:hypothetical protein
MQFSGHIKRAENAVLDLFKEILLSSQEYNVIMLT